MIETSGDVIEKEVRNIVTCYYKNLDGVAVLVIQGIHMLDLQASKGENEREADFLIVNYTRQYVCNIEVKRCLKIVGSECMTLDINVDLTLHMYVIATQKYLVKNAQGKKPLVSFMREFH